MELDPLGSGWVKPYVDKKDFFQDLKNPPKKVLKELLTENSSSDNAHSFLSQLENNRSPQTTNGTPNKEQSSSRGAATGLSGPPSAKEGNNGGRYSKIDPFDDTDPFEKADPFFEKSFGNSVELPSIFNEKSFDGIFPEMATFEKSANEDEVTSPNIFPSSLHGPLRVSLPPEKPDNNTPISLSSLTSKFRSSPSPPEDSKTLRRRNYQVLKQSTEDKGEDTPQSPVREEFFCTNRSPKLASSYSPKSQVKTFSKEKTFPAQKINKFWNEDFVESSPNPPPKPKAALFSIKPPPLPPKKQSHPRPPARPPSFEDGGGHYDYLRNQEESKEQRSPGRTPRSVLPLLPPPPQRKITDGKPPSDLKTKEGTGSVLNITLNQLDNTGLENLAVTLGIPSDHIYNMTLQELTKRLSIKYLSTSESSQAEPFKADFESNFGKMQETNSEPTYDKYAVFKELIENESKTISGGGVPEEIRNYRESEESSPKKQEEDRYAALRQLSMNPQKSENLSEDPDLSVEEDSSNKADNSDTIRPKTEDSLTPMNSVELAADSPVVKSSNDWSIEAFADKREEPEMEVPRTENEVTRTEEVESGEHLEFPIETKAASEKSEAARDNWATFDKVSVYEAPMQAEVDDNSPFSSDGKEDSYTWRKKSLKERSRNEVPWRDEDESWDDYSPKESYWSDESSHDDRSPEERRGGRYHRRTWSKQIRKSKGMGEQWCRRAKWDDTDDEYEESWKNHRCRLGTCDMDRKGEVCPLSSYDWCNNRNEPWQENDRYPRFCGDRRKKSETDDEYRRRCDSDTSDREYVWTSFKRSLPEGYGWSEKQKYHILPYTSRDCQERCHEPRSKHRKGESHKRPSSASDGKRNYEKICSGDHPKGKRAPEEDQSYRDLRHCCKESAHHYNSYDRRLQTYQGKKSSRNRKNEEEPPKPDSFDYYKSTWHKQDVSKNNRHFHFEDDFAPVTLEKSQSKLKSPKRETSRSPRKKLREEWTGHKDGNFRSDNNTKDNLSENAEEEQKPKQQILGKNHFAVLTRQESSTSLRKSESINIFSRENDPFEGDDFFSSAPSTSQKFNRFTAEKSKSNTNMNDAFTWKEVFGESSFHD